MTAAMQHGGRHSRVGRSFYLAMSIALTLIVTFGFSHTVPGDFAAPGLPPLLQLHAAVFVAWMLLFLVQPSLVMRGSIALHRKLGWVGAGLAIVMVVMGGEAILFGLRADAVPPFYPHGLFLVRGFVGLAVFMGLVAAGVATRRQGEWHKRLMLCASIQVIVPGLERALPIPLLGGAWPFVVDAVTVMLALAGPLCDLIVRGRIHVAYYWGAGAIVVGQILVDVLAPSSAAAFGLHVLGTG
jgi:uncharacterized membrane protein YozB (DUF420 family)